MHWVYREPTNAKRARHKCPSYYKGRRQEEIRLQTLGFHGGQKRKNTAFSRSATLQSLPAAELNNPKKANSSERSRRSLLNLLATPARAVATMESPRSSPTPHEAQGSFLTPTSGSGLKHRIRELECIIESELRSLQKQVQQFKCQKIVQTGRTEEVVQEAKDEMLAALQHSKNELKQFFLQQRAENQRIHEMIRALRNENFALQQSQLALQRRLQTAEVDLGQ